MTTLRTVTVLGTGVLGSQIAFQTAYSGFTVVAYDISEEVIEAAKTRFHLLATTYEKEVPGAADGKADEAMTRIRFSFDLSDAVADADLVIEAIPENLQVKRDTYERLATLAPPRTIFATNSSSLLPSSFADATGRPDRFLALHFANRIWANNTAEVMPTASTDPAVFETVADFAEQIGMVAIRLKKEKAGYVLNSLLIPLLDAAADLLVNDVADVATIDLTWRKGTGAPLGPFQIFDVIGLTTPYNIAVAKGGENAPFAKLLREQYLDKGKLGVASGEGFYTYP